MGMSIEQRRLHRARAQRHLATGGGTPGGFRRRNPTWPLHYVKIHQDGRTLDYQEAATLFVGEWWAPRAVYAGAARGMHCFERPPEGER